MKKILLSAFALIMAVSMQAQTLDEIVAKNITARGGLEKLKNLKTIISECTINAQGMEIPVKDFKSHNVGSKSEVSVMGMDNFDICNKKEGFKFFPAFGQTKPEKLTDDEVIEKNYEFDLQGEFIDYKTKGITLTLQGDEDVDGTMCHKILCIMPNKSEKRIFIDKETNHVIKELRKVNVNGKEIEAAVELSNFQVVDGYTMPYEISSPMGVLKIKKYTINSEIKDSIFELKK